MDCKFKVVPMRQQAAAAAATAAATVAASIGGPASSNGVQQQQYYYHHTHPPPHHRHNHSGVGGVTSHHNHTTSQQQQQQHQHHQRPHQSAASVDTLGTSGTTTSSHTHSQHTVSSEVVEGAVSGSRGGLVIEQGEGGGGSHLHQHISRRGGGGGQHHQHGQRQQQVVYQQQHHHHHHLVARSRSSSGGRGRASSAHASISRTAQQQSDLNTTQQQRSASASSLQRRNRAATCRECIRQQQQQQHTRQPPVTPRQQQQHRATYHTHSHQVICCRNSQCSLSDATHYICHRRQGGGGSRAGSAAGSHLDVDDDDDDDDVDIDDDAACLVASDGMDDVDDDELAADGDDEASLRALLISLQKQVSVMSMNLSAKLDQLQHGGGVDRQLETTVALREIRTQLQVLTRSVESCQSEVSEVKRDMVAIKHELDTVQQVKEEIEELREYVDRLEEHTHRRKLRLLEQGLTFFLTYAIFAAVLGMLQFGYNTGVINAPRQNIVYFMKDSYKERYGEEISDEAVDTLYSLAVGIFAIGGMLGGFMGGAVADRFGRKGGLLLNNVLGVTGGGLMWFTKAMGSYEMLFAGRFIIGVNCGLNTSLVPMYVSEIAPLNLRGGLGTVNQLAATVGLLLSQVLGIEQILGDNDGWPLLLGFAVCPALLQLVLLPICPESPRYLLITRQWEEEARRALRRLRASNQVEEDIEEMRAEERAQRAEASISMMELICSPTLRAPLIIGIVMQLSQQLSGINAVLYYSTSLFTSSGLTDESAKFATIGIGAIMVGMTLVSIPLMDRTGRRTLHLYGLGGMFIFSIFITISFLIKEMIDWMSYLSVVSTLSFVVFFAVGPGSIPWMITAELFSQGPRPAAMSIAVLVNWMANVVVGSGFPTMKNALENYTFLPFSVFLAIFWIFTYKKVPETKNKTFEEILAIFRHGNGRSMLNCVNSLDPHLPLAEQAGLVSEAEKTQQQESLRCSRSLSLARQLTLAEQGSVRSPSNYSYGGGNSNSYLLNRHGSTYRLRSQSAHDALRSLYYDYHQPRAHRSNQNTPLSVCRSNHQRLSLHQQYAASAAGSEHSSRSRDSQDSRDSRERDRDQHDGDAIATETSEHQPPPPQHHRRSTGDSSPESSRCSDRSPIVGTANSNQHLLHHQQLLDDDRSVSDANSVIHNVHYPQQYQYQPTQHQPTVQYPCGVMSGGGRPPPPLPPPRFPNNAV